LIGLLVYSRKVLKETITRFELYDAVTIIAGTLIISLEGIYRPEISMLALNVMNAIIITILVFGVGVLGMVIALKQKQPNLVGFVFGLVAGGCGALDPFFKAIFTGSGDTVIGWVAFAVSFGLGFAAFSITQWGFARKARANLLVPAYDSMYISLLVVMQAILLPGFALQATTLVGLATIIVGIVLMKAFKENAAGDPHLAAR
jgi:hypothetical protein